MDALDWKLDEEMPAVEKMVREEVRRLWNSGGIDTEDFDLSFKACLHVALLDVASRIRPFSNEGKKVVSNLKHF